MMRSFLRYEQDAQPPENTSSPTESAAPSESASPSESPAPTPRPAGVSATVASQLVYLRQEPSENSASVVLLAFGDPLTVYTQTGEWWQVSWEGSMGYLPASAVRLETSSETPGDSTVIRKARVTTVSGGLNMRMEGKSGSPILTVIPRNTVIDVLSVGNSWCQVSYGGRTGYVMTVFLTLQESTVTPTAAPRRCRRSSRQSLRPMNLLYRPPFRLRRRLKKRRNLRQFPHLSPQLPGLSMRW